MNPDLALDAELIAGSLTLDGVRGPVRVEVAAGSARLDGVRGPLDVLARAGSVTVFGRLDAGSSTIRCEAGAVTVRLDRGSSVRVRARANLGRVVLPGQAGGPDSEGWGGWVAGGNREVIIGDGAGSLDIEASMGSVQVHAER